MINLKNIRRVIIANFIAIFFFTTTLLSTSLTHSKTENNKNTAIEEIIVSARKQDEKLIDVPISISVIDDETIENSVIQNMHDLSYIVPGLSNTKIAGDSQIIAIRGIGNSTGTAPLTGIYLDEIPTSLPFKTIDLQAIDLQRIEVLKGPQGTLYGQGSVGGTIRFISKAPSLDYYGGSLGLSVYTTKSGKESEEITAIANIPIINNKLAFRLAATYKDTAGWIDQPVSNSDDVNSNELDHVRLKGLWQATDKLTANVTFLQHNNEADAADTINKIANTGSSDQLVLLNADGSIPSTHRSNDYDIYNILLTYELGFADIMSSSTKYDSTDKISSRSFLLNLVPFPGSDVGILNNGESNQTKGFTQEIRVNSDRNGWDWTVGLFYNDFDFYNKAEGSQLFVDSNHLGDNNPVDLSISSKSIAFFGHLSVDINERFNLGVGTRYFEDERELTGSFFPEVRNSEFDNISSNISLSYALSQDSNIYLSIAEGFRSGGLNFFSNLAYEPESVTAYEIGIKSLLLNGRLRAEAAIYFNHYADYQAQVTSLVGNIIQNPGEAEIQGFEITSQFKVSPSLSLGFNGNFNDTEFTKISTDSTGAFNVGDPISLIPEYSYSFYSDFTFNWSPATTGFARIDYNRQGPSSDINKSGLFSVPVSKSSAVGFLNAQIGAQFGNKLTARLFAKNINNEIRPLSPSISDEYAQNRPRTVGVDFNYDF